MSFLFLLFSFHSSKMSRFVRTDFGPRLEFQSRPKLIARGRTRNWNGSHSKELIANPRIFLQDENFKSGNNSSKTPSKKSKTMIPKRVKRIYQFFYQFFESSSIHGFGHLTATKRHLTEYILWAVCLMAAVTGTLYISSLSWKRYQNFPTVISMERDYKNWNTSFPTATVCPDDRVDEDKLRTLAQNYSVKDVEKFVSFFKQLASLEFETFDQLPDYYEISPDDFMRILVEAKFNFSYQVSNSFEAEDEELGQIITEMGLCYVYNSEVAFHFSPQNFWKKKVPKSVDTQLMYGSPLDGELFTQLMNLNSGYNLTATGTSEVPDVSTYRTFSVKLYYKTLEMTGISIISSEGIRGLSIKQRKCRFPEESDLELSHVYTYTVCRMQCRLNLAYKLCKCIPHFYRKQKNKEYCNVDGLRCLSKHGQYLADLREPNSNRKVKCRCDPLCNDVHFAVDVDTTMLWKISTNLRFGMSKYPKMRLRRDIIFSFSDLLVSVGGTAGLFLGCSVLSFIEIIYFFTLRLIVYIIRQLKRK